jgi:Ser/Thr protein kinase RdoA (MazF antagonist)
VREVLKTNKKEILSKYGLSDVKEITRIYRSAWDIDGKYILKFNTDIKQLEKSTHICNLLSAEGIPIPQYLHTIDKEPYHKEADKYYVLMEKLEGSELDPLIGDPFQNGLMLGGILSDLHTAMLKIGDELDCPESDCIIDFHSYILREFENKNILLRDDIRLYCEEFEPLYHSLPRQVIHRDTHLANLLFMDGQFTGWLDFDITQRNVRLFDLCYMGAAMLVVNYKDENLVEKWTEAFCGILTGYDKKTVLTDKEIKAVPYLFVIIELIFATFYSTVGEAETSVSCIEFANWIYEHREKIGEVRPDGVMSV